MLAIIFAREWSLYAIWLAAFIFGEMEAMETCFKTTVKEVVLEQAASFYQYLCQMVTEK